MKANYRQWLEKQKYEPNTIAAQMHRAARVEQYHGDLDEHYSTDQMTSLIESLRYSVDDSRRNRPNPSKIPFEGNTYSNLASYRDAVKRYLKFRMDVQESPGALSPSDNIHAAGTTNVEEEVSQRFGLERDMQATLRTKIEQLELGLTIIDDGAERSVDAGFIDITARDRSGTTTVIELKAGVAGQRAVAQILSYMGDVAAEEESGRARGILVASDFDAKAKAAARMVPNLILRKYSVHFMFSDGHL